MILLVLERYFPSSFLLPGDFGGMPRSRPERSRKIDKQREMKIEHGKIVF
jgi:hypothetical protein